MSSRNASFRIAPYAAVARAALADRLAYRSEVFLGSAMGAARVALALLLWSAVYAGRSEVGGMSLGLMTSYYLVAVFLFQIDQSSQLAVELASEIRGGRFGKYLARPVDPLAWFLAAAAGRSAFQASCALGAAALCATVLESLALGGAGTASLAPASILGALEAMPVAFLGLLCLELVNFMTAVLAFKFLDIGAFNMAKNCVVEFLSGALVPLALMPRWAREALGWTPFPSLASLPADLLLGRPHEPYARSLAVLSLWALALFAAARLLYARLSDRYEELGS